MLAKLAKCEKYFTSSRFHGTIAEAKLALNQNNLDLCNQYLDSLPDEKALLETLISKLEKKSVYKNLLKIQESGSTNLDQIKAFSSLLTHAAIECDHGNKEFGMLFKFLHDKIAELI